MTKTFYGLLPLADISANSSNKAKIEIAPKQSQEKENIDEKLNSKIARGTFDHSFHYNIQIHLPATKDVEVYNAIFKSLKEHLID
jgi:hypothetical protein